MGRSMRLYRWLLRLYPAEFRERYGNLLERQFEDDYADAQSTRGRLRFWTHVLLDFCRSMPPQLVSELFRDARHAARVWRRAPLHTGIAVAVLAVAIGANTGVFSVLNALLLRSLPFADVNQLAVLHMFVPADSITSEGFHRWRAQSRYLADAALYISQDVNGETSDGTGRLRLTQTTWNFFRLLGVEPLHGRAFVADEDGHDTPRVAIIGHGLWQQLYGSDPRAVGRTLRLNGVPVTIVGIAPPAFDYPARTAVWTPTALSGDIPLSGAIMRWTIGRIRPELTWKQARAAFEVEALDPAAPDERPITERARLVPLRDFVAGPAREASFVLMGGVALLLLLACAHLAHYLLARTLSRTGELRVRLALGASRARLAQQLLTEALLLTALALLGGLILASATANAIAVFQAAPLSSQSYAILDWRVLSFAATLALWTAAVFGTVPCLATRGLPALSGPAHLVPPNRGRIGRLLVAVQVALAIVLLTSSFALGRTLLALLAVDNGFELRSVATTSVSLIGTQYEQPERSIPYYEDVVRRLEHVPGVTAAGGAQFVPLGFDEAVMGASVTVDVTVDQFLSVVVPVWPGYFRSTGTRLLAGREFAPEDLRNTEPLAIVNEEFARHFGEPQALVGRLLTTTSPTSFGGPWPRRIVGVVGAARLRGPLHGSGPQIFWPARGSPWLTFTARVDGDARQRLADVRNAIASVDPDVPVFDVSTMGDRLDRALAGPRFYTLAVVFFGGLATLLAGVGIYGVVAAAVAERTRELGIRLALGTTPRRLRAHLMIRLLLTCGAGAIAGVTVALTLGHHVQNLVRGAGEGLPLITAAAAAVVMLTVATAAWHATRPAARIEISRVLRADGT